MTLNNLALKDQKLFNKYLSLARHELAAFSFSNIYIWKPLFDIRWVLIRENLCVFFRDKIGCFMYLPPLGKAPSLPALNQAFEIMDAINKNKDISRIENVEEPDPAYYRASGYRCSDKYPDYLCSRKDLALLKGNKFKSQRASYNYFVKHYDFDVRTLHPADKTGCLDLFNSWVDGRKMQCGDDIYCGMLEDNRAVIKAALADYRDLGFEGIVVKVKEQIRGFTFGYRLNNDTFCVLYEITDLSIKGLAQFIFRSFCEGLKSYKYINIMDDSGLDNLRKVKLAYKPLRSLPAYIVTRYA
ncbi:DUF2156 domain-containing protein [bacterium]|nr:MAG: DUF2156 domain-containing protein [bacterium]